MPGKRKTSTTADLKSLWQRGHFSDGKSFSAIKVHLKDDLGVTIADKHLSTTLGRSKGFLVRQGKRGSYLYVEKRPFRGHVQDAGWSAPEFRAMLNPYVGRELKDFDHNFGVSGDCCAFLLRKILEKLIVLAFRTNDRMDAIKSDSQDHSELSQLIDIATKTKVGTHNILSAAVARKISSTKFLGDTSAHNSMVTIDTEEVKLVLPVVVVAFKELYVALKK